MLKIVSWDSADDGAQPPLYPDAAGMYLICLSTAPSTFQRVTSHVYRANQCMCLGIERVNNLNVDLLAIPKEDLTGKWRGDTMYYECYPDVRITYHFATIQYRLYIGNKCYGEVQSGFED